MLYCALNETWGRSVRALDRSTDDPKRCYGAIRWLEGGLERLVSRAWRDKTLTAIHLA
jgi:hypothetical protein